MDMDIHIHGKPAPMDVTKIMRFDYFCPMLCVTTFVTIRTCIE